MPRRRAEVATPPMAVDPGPNQLEHAPCGFLTFCDDGTLTWINQTLLGMLGYDRKELIGQHLEQIFTIPSRIFYQTHWFPLLRMQGRAEEIFLMLRTKAGGDVGALVNAVRRGEGAAAEYDCVVMRVQERQRYENELLRARQAADRAAEELRAQKRELEQANQLLQAQAEELELQQQQLHEQAIELEDAGDELRAMNEDLLAQQEEANRLRLEAEEANQAKSTFLAVMSHELRTPLNAIAGYVQLLEMGIHGPVTEPQLETFGRITRSQRHLLRLINEVLNLARIESGRVEYTREDVDVRQLVEMVSQMVDPQLRQKELRLKVELPDGLSAYADAEKVQQVIINLLTNALKFTPAGGEIRVTGDAEDGQVALRISDTGIGIPSDMLPTIFDPFVQVDAGRTRADEGSGLGLSISRDLAVGMGGSLTVESKVGVGSTFTLRLPGADGESRSNG